VGVYVSQLPGTDVLISKIFSIKNLQKKLSSLNQITAVKVAKRDHNIGFQEKRQFFAQNERK
jgi:hypothetical protein